MSECVQEALREIGDIESDDPVGLDVHVGVAALAIDAESGEPDLAGEGDGGRCFVPYLEARVLAEEALRSLYYVLGEDIGDGDISHLR